MWMNFHWVMQRTAEYVLGKLWSGIYVELAGRGQSYKVGRPIVTAWFAHIKLSDSFAIAVLGTM